MEDGDRSKMKLTYFVHGSTIDNEKNISSGWNDAELSKLGVEQSLKLKELVKDKKFDAVFCSDLKRAIKTANLSFQNSKIIIDKRLRECNYGDYNGRDSRRLDKEYHNHLSNPFPNGESLTDVEKRIRNFLEEISLKFPKKQVAIVSHKSPQLAFEVIINKKTWKEALDTDWRISKSWQPGWEYDLK